MSQQLTRRQAAAPMNVSSLTFSTENRATLFNAIDQAGGFANYVKTQGREFLEGQGFKPENNRQVADQLSALLFGNAFGNEGVYTEAARSLGRRNAPAFFRLASAPGLPTQSANVEKALDTVYAARRARRKEVLAQGPQAALLYGMV